MKSLISKRGWISVAVILLVVILLAYVLDLGDLLDALRSILLQPLTLGGLFIMAGLVLISVRWRYLLAQRVSFMEVFHSNTISYMIRMFTPIYEVLLRVATLSMTTSLSVSQATPAAMAERLLETVMRIIALILALVLVSTTKIASGWVILWVFVLAVLFVGLVRFSNHAEEYMPRLTTWLARLPRMDEERLEGPLSSLGEGLSTVGTTRRLTLSMLLSLLMWGCFLIGHALILDSLDILGLNLGEMFAVSAAVLVVLPPSSPAMIGVYQGMMLAVLLPFQITDANTMLAFSILVFAVQVVFWVPTGLWSWKRTDLPIRDLIKRRGSGPNPEESSLGPGSPEEAEVS